jgi:hypothetical protein
MYKGKNPDMDNYKKLLHIMQYLRATKDLILTQTPKLVGRQLKC